MKNSINCKREFATLNEDKRPVYLVRSGKFLTNNAGVFPLIPYTGAVISTHALTLLTLISLRDESEEALKSYDDELALCIKMMDANYDYIDLVAQGDGNIIAQAGVAGSSQNTARTDPPSIAVNLKYIFVDEVGEIQITHDKDKLAHGTLIVTFTDPAITVVKSGNGQLKITTADGTVIFVDIVTSSKANIQNLKQGNLLNSVVTLFNPNGISPVASPASIVVPR